MAFLLKLVLIVYSYTAPVRVLAVVVPTGILISLVAAASLVIIAHVVLNKCQNLLPRHLCVMCLTVDLSRSLVCAEVRISLRHVDLTGSLGGDAL